MNWQYGLFRLWLVVSGIWAVFTVGAGVVYFIPLDKDIFVLLGVALGVLAVAVVPSVVVFVVGWLLLWAFKGFRQGKG